jgi:hypothetical protein
MAFTSPARPKHAPRHRQTRANRFARSAPGTVVRNTMLFSSVAVAATGATVAGGVLEAGTGTDPVAADSTSSTSSTSTAPIAATLSKAAMEDRRDTISRSDSRDRTDQDKAAALSQDTGEGVTRSEELTSSDPREIAQALMPEYGFSGDQFGCLDSLYVSESDWDMHADNPTSSAYGIPQALTETHEMPPGYFTSAEVQIRWGLDYIADSYGSPCAAWEFKQANNWY